MKALTPNEKRLYWTMWSVVALVAAIWFSMRDKPLAKPVPTLAVVLDSALRERFLAVDVEKNKTDYLDATFHLQDAFLATVTRFEKEMTIAFVLKRGALDLDRGEFRIVIKPLVTIAVARFPNRKKVDFDTVELHLPH